MKIKNIIMDIKKIILCMAVCTAMFTFTGCFMVGNITVNPDSTVNVTSKMGYDKALIDSFGSGASATDADDGLTIENINGKDYYVASSTAEDNAKYATTADLMKEEPSMKITPTEFYAYAGNGQENAVQSQMGLSGDNKELFDQYFEYADLVITFPYKVVNTNGIVDEKTPNTVTFHMLSSQLFSAQELYAYTEASVSTPEQDKQAIITKLNKVYRNFFSVEKCRNWDSDFNRALISIRGSHRGRTFNKTARVYVKNSWNYIIKRNGRRLRGKKLSDCIINTKVIKIPGSDREANLQVFRFRKGNYYIKAVSDTEKKHVQVASFRVR
ncbi:MAG: hypothetical protein VZR00_02995 [Lachnospiraceae bacterium]|jgi:hypothetical protein|nr:hypothetical protein [Lachnospiraceae bacterium]MEE3460843.1 hypothetical protein [Lachnospiraceae bacterium]